MNEEEIPTFLKKVLMLGLSFIMKPSDEQLTQDISNLSEKTVQQNNHILKTFINLWKPLKSMFKILPTDKNMGCCIISQTLYAKLKLDLLQEKNTFEIEENLTEKQIIEEFQKDIMNNFNHLKYYILPSQSEQDNQLKLPIFKGIPKVHKNPVKLRPIVDCSKCATTNLASLLHIVLIKIVKRLKHHSEWVIENTDEYINRIKSIEENEVKDLRVFTADIKSLYTNIPISHLKNALSFMLHSFRKESSVAITQHKREKIVDITNNEILELTELYLRYNYLVDIVEGKGQVYKQKTGIPTGGNCSPDLANIFLAFFEINFRTFNEQIWNTMKFSGRYLDDVIILTKNRSFSWKTIQEDIYQNTIDLEDNSIEDNMTGIFLDIQVFIDTKGFINYTLYRKPGNAYQYIHYKSFLPSHIKRNFIQNETQRIKKRCRNKHDFLKNLQKFKNQLKKRGYPNWFIHRYCKIKNAHHGNKRSSPEVVQNQEDTGDKPLKVIPYNTKIPAKFYHEYKVVFKNQRKLNSYLK